LKRACLIAVATIACLRAEVKLPALISDHMLIQQGVPVHVWGKAAPDEPVTVTFRSSKAVTKADGGGRWQVYFEPVAKGGPYEMTVAGSNQIVVKDILVGEVWVGSGQSNMEFSMARVKDADAAIAAAKFPQVRLFTVKKAVADEPVEDVTGSWSACEPETVKNFSAVLYFFGREIHETQKVPVGLIHSSWGGTPAQSWTEMGYLQSDPALQMYLTDWQKVLADYPSKKDGYAAQLTKWEEQAAAAKSAGTKAPAKPGPPQGPGHQNTPAGLYNAMIAPLTPYPIRGAAWYQGESNASQTQAYLYRRLFADMIESWRKAWGEGSFPFYFVQLANYKTNGWWPLLRESQTATLELKNTGMALAIDVGNPTDIHPTDKQTVGHRLALAARAGTYGEKIVHTGPVFHQMTTTGAEARLWFERDSVAGGLEARGGMLTGFAIAGADMKFVAAKAKVTGATVVVSSPDVPEPKAVRYGWADDPAANLYNREGLPAVPFRTDDWKEATALSILAAAR
jgi:sialate O-acetylesterase